MALGSLFALLGPAAIAFASHIWMVAAGTAALGLGIGLIITQSFDLVGSVAPRERVASIGGLVYVLKMIGAAVGGQVAVSFVGAGPNPQGFLGGFSIATIAMLIAAVAAFSLRGRQLSATATITEIQ
jgi:hypothetical protein